MSKRKVISLAVALVLCVGAYAPQTVYSSRRSAEPTAARASSSAQDEARRAKRKGNSFGRALSAPFRALAKLFGGGDDKPKAETAKKSAPQSAPVAVEPREEAAQSAAPVPAPAPIKRGFGDSEPPAPVKVRPAPLPVAKNAKSAKPTEGVRIVRPDDPAPAPPQPKSWEVDKNSGRWVASIKGISKDPLTQGRAMLEQGYLNEAVAELSIAATVGPDLVEANNLLGLTYDRLGWHKSAVECYERALTVEPKNSSVLANFGYSLYLAGDYNSASKRLKQALKLAPGVPVINNHMGIVQAQLGKYDEAFKSFARASNPYDAHLKVAGLLESAQREKDAIRHYEAALQIQPGTFAILERLAPLYERTGNYEKALATRRTLGQPSNPQRTTTGGGGGGD